MPNFLLFFQIVRMPSSIREYYISTMSFGFRSSICCLWDLIYKGCDSLVWTTSRGFQNSTHVANTFDIPDNVIMSFQEHYDEKIAKILLTTQYSERIHSKPLQIIIFGRISNLLFCSCLFLK